MWPFKDKWKLKEIRGILPHFKEEGVWRAEVRLAKGKEDRVKSLRFPFEPSKEQVKKRAAEECAWMEKRIPKPELKAVSFRLLNESGKEIAKIVYGRWDGADFIVEKIQIGDQA